MNLRFNAIPAPSASGAALLVHGGAWDIPDGEVEAHKGGLHEALNRGRARLEQGTSALDVVMEVVAVLEAHPAFDAGYGAVLNQSGEVELDAGLMCGETLGFGAVAGVKRIAHPIQVAHRLLQRTAGQARLLIAEGAEAFAAAEGFTLIENETLMVARERIRFRQLQEAARFHTSHAFLPSEGPRGTVGCVCRDREGRLAAATSTGGAPYTLPGRVGDSPLPGCGYYATPHAAISTTGWGEAIATVLLAGRTVDRIVAGQSPAAAAQAGLAQMYQQVRNQAGTGATGGLIVLDRIGRGAWAYTTPRMARAGWAEGREIWAMV